MASVKIKTSKNRETLDTLAEELEQLGVSTNLEITPSDANSYALFITDNGKIFRDMEIRILERLMADDTYLAHEFRPSWERMRYNIQSDFPLLMGTPLGDLNDQTEELATRQARIWNLQSALELEEKNHAATMAILSAQQTNHEYAMTELLGNALEPTSEFVLYGRYGDDACIKAKLTCGLPLTDSDRAYLVENKFTNK